MYVHELEEPRSEERRPPKPVAAMPPHALLALQRSAGNQAVGRVLARDMGKQARGRLTAKYRGAALPASADDMLLEIYNTLRSKCRNPRVPGAWTSVATAVAELKKQNVIDDVDEAAFTEAAAVAFGGEKKLVDHGPAMLEALKKMVAEKRPSIDAKHKHHIFQGDFKSDDPTDPTGYHSKKGSTASTTHEAYGTPTPVPNEAKGVYQQSVRGKKAPKKKKAYRSTFFPDTATEDDVLDAITSVYGSTPQAASVQYPVKLKGMTLQTIGDTVFPAGGQDLDPE